MAGQIFHSRGPTLISKIKPLASLHKARMMPVMIWGIIIAGKAYSGRDWLVPRSRFQPSREWENPLDPELDYLCCRDRYPHSESADTRQSYSNNYAWRVWAITTVCRRTCLRIYGSEELSARLEGRRLREILETKNPKRHHVIFRSTRP